MNIKDIISQVNLKGEKVNVFVWDNIPPNATSNKGIITNIKLIGGRGVSVQFEGLDYSIWFYEKSDTDKTNRYMSELSFFAHQAQEWVNLLEYSQQWPLIDNTIVRGTRSYNDITNSPHECQVIFDKFYSEMPKSTPITNTYKLQIGDTLIYTRNPRGSGMYVPEVGKQWKLETENDIINASIEIIERGRGWQIITN